MTAKPILFNTEMVRAILEGRKTVTRRVVKPVGQQKRFWEPLHSRFIIDEVQPGMWQIWLDKCGNPYATAIPPYRPGDVLYVRETWNFAYQLDGNERPIEETGRFYYAADGLGPFTLWVTPDGEYKDHMPWRPSIHMPREAARIFLRVKDVRVERLQDSFSEPISPIFELLAEGVDIGDDCRECIEAYGNPCCVDTVDEDGSDMYGGECGLLDDIRGDFSDLWDSTIKPADRDLYGWAANPWVWVIEFERISKEEVPEE